MPKYPTFFRADDDIEVSDKGSPSPNEWFGMDKTKFRTPHPALSADEEEETDGWRQFFKGSQPRDPLKNELLNDKSRGESLRFKNALEDKRALVYVLEQAAEIFEAEGYIDLAADCERICESALEDE